MTEGRIPRPLPADTSPPVCSPGFQKNLVEACNSAMNHNVLVRDGGSVSFKDQLSAPEPSVFNGKFTMASATFGFVLGVTNFVMGGAVGESHGAGMSTDVASGSFSFFGVSASKGSVIDCCE